MHQAILTKVLPLILSVNFGVQIYQGDYTSALTSLLLAPVMAHAFYANKPKEEK
ncbi:hypothetical protein [Bacillus paranthracis]|uniref:hypothetical protein n=1 Tax=Bacillus paranthracis TaxID=2026186 RepID=UPI0013D7A205|nr:hypothetical protein [Bacillus paranthracis]